MEIFCFFCFYSLADNFVGFGAALNAIVEAVVFQTEKTQKNSGQIFMLWAADK